MAGRSSSSSRKSATRAERKRAAFREWLLALAEGRARTPAHKLYERARTPSAQRIGKTWKTISNDVRPGRDENEPRMPIDWRAITPPL